MFGLPESTLEMLTSYFFRYPEIEKVKIYGSRAKGNYKRGSDIDLAFYCRSENDLTARLLFDLDELPTPYLFNVTNYYRLKHKELKEHIDRMGQLLYENKHAEIRNLREIEPKES